MQTMTILGSENNRVQNTFETIFLNAGILSPLSDIFKCWDIVTAVRYF